MAWIVLIAVVMLFVLGDHVPDAKPTLDDECDAWAKKHTKREKMERYVDVFVKENPRDDDEPIADYLSRFFEWMKSQGAAFPDEVLRLQTERDAAIARAERLRALVPPTHGEKVKALAKALDEEAGR